MVVYFQELEAQKEVEVGLVLVEVVQEQQVALVVD